MSAATPPGGGRAGKTDAGAAMSNDQPPFALAVDGNVIPTELTDTPRFVGWRWERRGDRWTKPLVNPASLRYAATDRPATWGTLAEAMTAYRTHGLAGIGIVLTADDPYVMLDLDKCRDRETGELAPWADGIVGRFPGAYAEASPSGTGIRILLRGVLTGARHRRRMDGGELELYDRGRYATLTGHQLAGAGNVITDGQAALDALYAELFPDTAPGDPPAPRRETATLTADDEALLDLARGAANGRKFADLFDRGDTSGHDGDDSAADLALVSILRFWCQGDAVRIDRLFRRSKLMRDKWDERRGDRTYGRRTIDTALKGGGDVYEPSGSATWTWPLAIGRRQIVRTPIGRRKIGRTRIATVVAGRGVAR